MQAKPSTQVVVEDQALRLLLAEHNVPCPACGYCLKGLRELVCPECGLPITEALLFPEQPSHRRLFHRLALAIITNVVALNMLMWACVQYFPGDPLDIFAVFSMCGLSLIPIGFAIAVWAIGRQRRLGYGGLVVGLLGVTMLSMLMVFLVMAIWDLAFGG